MSNFNLLEKDVIPAEDESLVRAYHCTSLKSRLLAMKAEGFLSVTNRRVIFYAFGSSYGGKSILQSEVPIEDVSGISSYKGNYFSLMHLLTAIGASFIIANFVNFFVMGLLTVIGSLLLTYSASQTFSQNQPSFGSGAAQITGSGLSIVLLVLAAAVFFYSLTFKRDRIYRSIFAGISTLLFFDVSGYSFMTGSIGSFLSRSGGIASLMGLASNAVAAISIFLGLIASVYTLVCVVLYARRETISLAIGSQGGSSTPIAISGISSFSLYNTAAMRALSAEPAEDAETMIKELGAMILDIQTMGDLGISKWKGKPLVIKPDTSTGLDTAAVSPAY